MIKFLFFTGFLFAFAFFAQYMGQDTGEAVIHWHGYEVRMQASFLAAVIAFFCILFFFGGQLWAFIVEAPQTFERWRYKKRYENGFNYFLEGFEALSAGEVKQAKKLANKTQKLLPDKRLSHILGAETAAISGQSVKAITYYEKLANSSKNQFIGLKGLMEQFKLAKNWPSLKKCAEKAYLLKPKSELVVDNLLHASMKVKDFDRALQLIPQAQKYSSYTSEKLDEFEAYIYIEQAKFSFGKEKIKLLEKSLKARPNCIQSIKELVPCYDTKKALKTLQTFFQHTGSLVIYDLWVDIMKDESQKYYKRRLKALLKGRDKTFLYYLIQGKELLRREDYKKALTSFQEARKQNDCQEVEVLMASTAFFLGGHESEVKVSLKNISAKKAYSFEGNIELEAYKIWKEEYVCEDKHTITKSKSFIKQLTSKAG